MAVLEALSDEECYLLAILTDASGIDLAEFTWYDATSPDGCWRARPYQWPWWRDPSPLQIDQCARDVGKTTGMIARANAFPYCHPGQEMVVTAPELVHLMPVTDAIERVFHETRLGNETMPKGRSKMVRRPFRMNFTTGARIIGRIPQVTGRAVKGLHPVALEMDECFPASTLVLTRRGLVAITAVVVGDEVLTHRCRWRRVTAVHDRGVRSAVVVRGQGHPGMVTTANHKFWARREGGRSEWIRASELVGCCWAAPAGELGRVRSVTPAGACPMFDLSVEEDHSFVADGVVVSNSQDYPDAGWVELMATLRRGIAGAMWRAHGVTRGIRDKFFEFTQPSKENPWKVHRLVAMHRDDWNDEERQRNIIMYGSREAPDYRRNILGLHGDPANALFVLSRLMRCCDLEEASEYNTDLYRRLMITGEQLEEMSGASSDDGGEDEESPEAPGWVKRQVAAAIQLLDFGDLADRYTLFWGGQDVGYCTDVLTEIFTRRGWLRWDEVEAGDESLAIDPATGRSGWQTISSVYRERVDTTMISMRGQAFDSLTTPHHRWLVRGDSGRWRWKETRMLNTKDRIPLAVPRGDAPVEAIHQDEFVELVAWFWTEGSLGQPASLSQSHTVNPGGVERITKCLEKLYGPGGPMPPGPYRAQRSPHRWRSYQRFGTMTYWTLAKPVADELRQVMDAEKAVTVEFLSTLTLAQLALFIETSILADGWVERGSGRRLIEQSSERRIRSFEAACVLAGLPSSTCYDPHRDRWHLAIKTGSTVGPVRAAAAAGSMRLAAVPYHDVIWCPTISHGNWLARRNGSVYFTGNTVDPSEILIAAEYMPQAAELRVDRTLHRAVPEKGVSRLRIVARIQLKRVSNPVQVAIVAHVIRHFKMRAFGLDKTGNGIGLFMDLQALDVGVASVVRGYNFSEKVIVGIDGTVEVTDTEDILKEAALKSNVLEYSTDVLRELVDHNRWMMPFDRDVIREFQGQTWSYSKALNSMDAYGRPRRVFSQGNFHALDAARMLAMAHAQAPIEEIVRNLQHPTTEAVLDVFLS